MRPTPLLLTLFASLSLTACLSESEPSKDGTWLDPSKADIVSGAVEQLGRLSFGGEVFGDFVKDDQLDGYTISAEEGAVLSLDNSNLGTKRRLDSTLFIYGPADQSGNFGSKPIAFDDDSGWGLHARIKNFTIPERGEYQVVISTYAGADRGHYRLALECAGESCVIPCDESCGHQETCSGQVCDESDGCVSQDIPQECTSDVVVSTSNLQTSAGGDADTFTVSLRELPVEDVIIRLETSDVDQAAVFPTKINFCKSGFVEKINGCKPIEADDPEEAESWSRSVVVTVVGVRSLLEDGDRPFTISMRVESDDTSYGTIELAPISGMNLGDSAAPTLAEFSELQDADLLNALHDQTKDHLAFGYRGQNSARNMMFAEIDVHDGLVESIYDRTTILRSIDSTEAFQQGFNTEHSWPQSQFDKLEPAVSDLHHIYPSESSINSLRSSFDFGMVDDDLTSSVLGDFGSTSLFQVRSERRGDIARAHFYLVARYQNDTTMGVEFDDDGNLSNGSINDREEQVLRAWSDEDPVDDIERIRNNRIEGYQGNRNPFVDRPSLINQISDF